MSKITNGGLDLYGAEPFEQQKFGTAGVEGVRVEGVKGKLCNRFNCVANQWINNSKQHGTQLNK